MTATIAQSPYNMGRFGVVYALVAIQGNTIPELIDTGTTLVTADVTLQTWLRDLEDTPPVSEAAFKEWLYRAARRKIIDRLRHQSDDRSPHAAKAAAAGQTATGPPPAAAQQPAPPRVITKQ